MSSMSFRAAALALLFLLPFGSAGAANSLIIERSTYAFPTWTDAVARTDAKKYTTEEEYGAAVADSRFVMEKLRYRSDGLSVIALIYRAKDTGATKQPVVVFNRGSFVRKDIAPEMVTMFQRLALAGFAVVAPMYRGSDGGEGRDELGGADLNDLMNIVPVLREIETLDVDNLFLYGESRGGMMVFQAIRDGFPARAAATFGAFSDLGEMISSTQGATMAKQIWPDINERKNEIVLRRSAIAWPERLTLPLLLMHGSKDRTVAPSQTLRLAAELSKAAKDFGLILFQGGSHTLFQHRLERDRQVTEFFRRHVGKQTRNNSGQPTVSMDKTS